MSSIALGNEESGWHDTSLSALRIAPPPVQLVAHSVGRVLIELNAASFDELAPAHATAPQRFVSHRSDLSVSFVEPVAIRYSRDGLARSLPTSRLIGGYMVG